MRRLSCLLVGSIFCLANNSHGQSTRPGLGSIPYVSGSTTGTTFRVWAPNATNVTVRGDFNGWGNTTLIKEATNGNWSIDINNARPGQNYKYRINGVDKRDPRARSLVNSGGNSIIYSTNAFNWGNVPKPAPARNDLVIYQMHIGTFEGGTPPRTFDQAITRLDHVKNLGINVIKLMPVNEWGGTLSWGYNPADPFAIESDYGNADAFKRFMKACHERSISVFMDVVHNHYNPSDMWQFDGWSQNGKGGIYFYNTLDGKADTAWGPRPDFGRSEVRSYIRDQIMMFVEEYRIGGFRWDSVANILYYNNNANYNADGFTLLRDINWELSQNYPEVVRGSEDHAFDQPMNFEYVWDVSWRWSAHGQLTQSADANRSMAAVKGLYDGWASLNRVVFTEAHDYIATMNGNRTRVPSEIDPTTPESIWARKRALLGGSIVMTVPGIPMIFQGQEMHETQAFQDSTPLRWTRTNTFAGIVRAYRDLIHLRRNIYGGMNGLKGTGINVNKTDEGNKVVTFIRWNAGGQVDDVMGVINFAATMWTNNNYLVDFPSTGTWYRYFNSDSTNYASDFGNIGAATVEATGTPPRAAVNMGMYSLQLFSKTPANFTPVAPSVAFNPPAPTGCVNVAITYNPGTGPLMDSPRVNIYLGRNGWLDVTNATMTSIGSNTWRYTHTLVPGTLELNMAFNNGSNIWDNNNSQNWSLPVTSCNALGNTNPAALAFATAEQTVISNTLSGLITIQIVDENDQITLATNDTTVELRSSLSGTFRNTNDTANITSVVVGNGQSAASFRYRSSTLGTHTLTASNATLLVGTQSLNVVAPPDPFDLRVSGNGAAIADGSATPTASNFTAFGETLVGTNFIRMFTVTNSGSSALGLGTLQITGAAAADFTAVNPLPASLAIGSSTNVTISFAPSAAGTRSATISFTNSSSAKSPYDFAINGIGVVPVIALSTTSLSTSNTVGNSPSNLTFSVTNSGSGVMAYTVSADQNWLSVSPTNGNLNAGAGQSHTVVFSTAGLPVGTYGATVTVSAAYASNSPRRITVALNVRPAPTASRLLFASAPRNVIAGQVSDLITIALADAQGNLIPSTNNRVIHLASDKLGTFRNSGGSVIITNVVISNGFTSADFRYSSSTEGGHLIVASDSGSLGSVTQTLTISSYIADTFTNNTQFVVPAGVTQLVVEAWGGGGGALRNGTTRRPGGGGGAYARSTLTVTPGSTFNVVVGAGGAAGNPGVTGGDSSFGNSSGTNLLAKGGGGASGTSTVGAGGSANSSIITNGVRFSGGAGGARGPSGGGGGGGGGSAFTNANGTVGSAGTSTAGGVGGSGTGNGGNGGAPNAAGQAGFSPGGGGGGNGNGNGTSGAGARGMVKVTYTILRNGIVTLNPEFPQGCVPVTITYNDNNGVLSGAQQVNVLIGHNNWTFSQTVAMTRSNANEWVVTYTIPEGTVQMELVFNNNAGTWDSNNGQNWPVYVTGCVLSEPATLAITDPPSDTTVPYQEQVITVRGEATMIAGNLDWQNTLTGETGTVPAGQAWELSAADLEVGPNVFRVSGMSSTNNPNDGARDSATNTTYNTGWTNAANGGVNWSEGWTLSATANSGHFIANTVNNPNLLIGPRAWGMWANTGGFSESRRNFNDRLHQGDKLTFRWQHNTVQAGGSAGFGLRNFYNETLFEFYLSGGSNEYTIRDAGGTRISGIAAASGAKSITFELITPITYRLTVGASVITNELASGAELFIRRFRAWNFNTGAGEAGNIYLNDLAVSGVSLEPEMLTAQRTITRKYGPSFSYAPGTNRAAVTLAFPATEIGYIYEVVGKTNLMDPIWTVLGTGVYGNGQSLEFSITNENQNIYLRTRMRPVE